MPRLFRLVVLVMTAFGANVSIAAGDVFDQFFKYVENKNKVIEPHLPGESVDHFTGTLRIVQEDLSFPGKGGLDLRIVRTYSSKLWERTDLLVNGDPLLAKDEPAVVGFGWLLHMGRLRQPTPPAPQGTNPIFPVYEAPDGSARAFYNEVNSTRNFKARDFWKLDNNCTTQGGPGACMVSTTGLRLEFANANRYFIGTTLVWPVSAIVDVAGNTISVFYQSGGGVGGSTGRISRIVDSYQREVTFNYMAGCTVTDCRLDSIEASATGGTTRRVEYQYDRRAGTGGAGRFAYAGNRNFLTKVLPDVGPGSTADPGYEYDYDYAATVAQNQYALKRISYPYGGSTSYTYATRNFFTGCQSSGVVGVPMAVVRSRVTSWANGSTTTAPLTSATWTYDYSSPGNRDFQVATVTRPDQLVDTFEYFGFGFVSNQGQPGFVFKVGLQHKITRASGAEVESFDWDQGPVVVAQRYAAPAYDGICQTNFSFDNDIRSPLLTKHEIIRGGRKYRKTYSGHDQFAQPATVTETGELPATGNGTGVARVTTLDYDYDDVAPSNRYQVVGRIKKERVCIANDCLENSRTFNEPRAARVDSETLKGIRTEYEYWPDGNLWKVTNARGQTLTLSQYDFAVPELANFNGAFVIERVANWDGTIQSETNGRGDRTRYEYDGAARLTKIIPPGPSGRYDDTTYDYAPTGESYAIVKGSGASQYVQTIQLDGLGREVGRTNNLGAKQTTERDAFGRRSFQAYPFAPGQPEVGDKFAFDSLGRLTTTWQRIGRTVSTSQCAGSAQPNCSTVSVSYGTTHCEKITVQRAAAERTTTSYCFRSFGSLAQEQLTSVIDGANQTWRYAYDVAGNLKAFDAPRAAGKRSFTYTPATFLLKTDTSGPRGTTTIDAYNALGQRERQTDSRGVTETRGFSDPLSRLKTISYGASPTGDDVELQYDRDIVQSVGSPNGGTYSYEYDGLGRVTLQRWDYRGRRYETRYDYDRAGCLEKLTYPTGSQLRMSCDREGRPTTINRADTATAATVTLIANNIQYHPVGRVTSMAYGNGRTVSTTLESGRVKSIQTPAVGALPAVVGLRYTYDGANNIKTIVDDIDSSKSVGINSANRAVGMTYDALDRLAGVPTPAGDISFKYDELGNRREKGVPGKTKTTYQYDGQTNRLTTSSGPSAPSAMTLAWNATGRLSTSSDGASYRYDALGRRVLKQLTPTGPEIVYHYDHAGRLIAETLVNGDRLREYYYVAGQLVAVDGCVATNQLPCVDREWYHTDLLGSVVARTNAQGGLVTRSTYGSWGESSGAGRRGYNGRNFDDGTGFYDYGARMFSPELGRFLSPDAVWSRPERPQSANDYAYVLNNPYQFVDPSGSSAVAVNWFTRVTAPLATAIGNLLVAIQQIPSQAATADGGVGADAGVSDAGHSASADAGTSADAGSRDAGTGTDAGVRDAGVADAGIADAGVPDAGVPLPWEIMRDIAPDAGFVFRHGLDRSGHNPGSRHYTGQAVDINHPLGNLPDGGTRLTNADVARARAFYGDAGFGVLDERYPPPRLPDGGYSRVWGGPHLHISTDGR